MASTFSYGSLALVRDDGSSRTPFPLVIPKATFGRVLSCDVRILCPSVSKLHAVINVEETEPYQATLSVHSINGLQVNEQAFNAGQSTVLQDGDLIIICQKTFRFEGASTQGINLNSPPASQRRPLRYSLIASANVNTPSNSPAGAIAMVEESELLGWDEEPEIASDGQVGDLITWDEYELEEMEEVEYFQEEQVIIEENEQVEENVIAGTPIKERFFMNSTPSLAHRSRAQFPASAQRAQSTPVGVVQRRRRSMRMTIVPSDRAVNFVLEREANALAREAAFQAQSPKPTTPIVSPQKSPSKVSIISQVTPSRQSNQSTPRSSSTTSTPRIASATSSTSRRISALLLSSARPLIFTEQTGQDALEESDSSEDEEEMEPLQYGREVEEPETGFEEVSLVAGQYDDGEELSGPSNQSMLMNAAGIPLPDSPYGSPTATPAKSVQTTPSMPRHSISRPHSLRERLLIRSVHKKSISPTDSPVSVAASPVVNAIVAVEVEQATEEEEEEEEEEEPEIVRIESPSRGHRDSIELTRTRSPARVIETAVVESAIKANPASARRMSIKSARASLPGSVKATSPSKSPVVDFTVEVEDLSFEAPASPSPIERTPVRVIAARPRVSLSARRDAAAASVKAASVALPVTPAGESSWTPKPTPRVVPAAATPVRNAVPSFKFDTPEPVQFNIATATPILSGLNVFPSSAASRPKVNTPRPEAILAEEQVEDSDESFEAEAPAGFRAEFKSQMTSPVNHHRVMATPKSALRVGMANFSTALRNPFTSSLFSLTAPATLKRKVAFNEEVYIQEILDIRDPQIHWDEARDAIDPASVPLPDSPAVSRSATPRSVRVATPRRASIAEGTPIRRAQRVPTDNPPESVKRVMMVTQASPRRSATRAIPVTVDPVQTIDEPQPTPITSPRKASRVVQPATPGDVEAKEASPTKRRASRGAPVTPAVVETSTPRSVGVMRAERAVINTPVVKKVTIEPTASAVTTRKANIQRLMDSPAPRLSTYDNVPKSAPRPLSDRAQKAEARRQSMPSLEFVAAQSQASVPAAEGSEVVESAVEVQVEEIEVAEPIIKNSTPVPTRIQNPMPTQPTPSFVGIRSLFSTTIPTAPLPPKTPNFSGFTNLFLGSPTATSIATPQLGGVREMMQGNKNLVTPRFGGIRGLFVGAKEKVGILVEEGDLDQFEVPAVVEEVEEVEEVVEVVEEVVEEIIKEVVIPEEVEVESVVVEDVIVVIEVAVEEPVVEEPIVEEIEEEIVIESVELPVVEALVEVVEPVIEEVVVEESPVEDLVEEEINPIVEVPVLAIEEVIESIEAPVVELIEVVAEEVAIEEPAPVVRKGRATKVAKAPVKAKAAPKRTARQIKADLAAAEAAEMEEVEVEVEVAEIEMEEEIIVKPVAKTRTSRAKATPTPVVVEEEVEEEVVPVKKVSRAAVKTPTPAVARRSGRSTRQDISEDVEEVEEVEVVKPVRASRKTAVKKATVVEVVVEEEPEVEPIVEEPVVEAVKATRGKRTPKAAVVIHEDDVQETPIAKPTRGGRAKATPLQPTSSSTSLVEEVLVKVPLKTKKASVVEVEVEEEQENKVVKKAPVKRAVKKVAVVEEVVAPVGRSMRTRR